MKNEEDKEEEKVPSDITGFYSPDISISLKLQMKEIDKAELQDDFKGLTTTRQWSCSQQSLWDERRVIWSIGFRWTHLIFDDGLRQKKKTRSSREVSNSKELSERSKSDVSCSEWFEGEDSTRLKAQKLINWSGGKNKPFNKPASQEHFIRVPQNFEQNQEDKKIRKSSKMKNKSRSCSLSSGVCE